MSQAALRAILGLVLLLCGCADSSNKIQWIRTSSNLPRLGNAYLVLGWQGISKAAMEELATKVSKSGVQTQLIAESQWRDLSAHMRLAYESEAVHEPIVLIGYSYGADNSLRVAHELKNDDIAIDLLVTIDPVTPPKVAGNIKRCINYYQSNGGWDIVPIFRGMPLHKESESSPTELSNWNLRTDRKDLLEPGIDHFSIPKDARVQDEIVAQGSRCVPAPGPGDDSRASTMNWPALAIVLIVGFYWARVLRLAYKIRKRTGSSAHALPPEPVGRVIRLIWYPLVILWIVIPLVDAFSPDPGSRMRFVGAIVGFAALLATMVCWRRMGKSWRMGIDPGEKTTLIVTGPYAYVRHPIYALSAILMIASVVAVPNRIMIVVAAIHLMLLYSESRREEKHLLAIHGGEYARYLAQTGRFLPRSLSPFRSDR